MAINFSAAELPVKYSRPKEIRMAILRTKSRASDFHMPENMLSVCDWTFMPCQKNTQGLRFSQISNDRDPVYHSFEASSYFYASYGPEGNHTPSLQLTLQPKTESEIDCMISCIRHHVEDRCEEFGMTQQQAIDRFKSPFVKNGMYPANLRVKLAGARYWSADENTMSPPTTHAAREWKVRVHFKSVWVSSDAWGLSCQACDLQEITSKAKFPF